MGIDEFPLAKTGKGEPRSALTDSQVCDIIDDVRARKPVPREYIGKREPRGIETFYFGGYYGT